MVRLVNENFPMILWTITDTKCVEKCFSYFFLTDLVSCSVSSASFIYLFMDSINLCPCSKCAIVVWIYFSKCCLTFSWLIPGSDVKNPHYIAINNVDFMGWGNLRAIIETNLGLWMFVDLICLIPSKWFCPLSSYWPPLVWKLPCNRHHTVGQLLQANLDVFLGVHMSLFLPLEYCQCLTHNHVCPQGHDFWQFWKIWNSL